MVSKSKKRLIDANALAETYRDTDERFNHEPWNLSEILDFLKDAPTVDAVEVVRCKDCARRKKGYCSIRKDGWGAALLVGDTDFCSDGERRADEGRNSSVQSML